MTLNDLIRKAQSLAMQMSSGDVPLYDEQYVEIQNIRLDVLDDDDGEGPYIVVEIR